MGSSPTPGTMEELNKYIKGQLSSGVDKEIIKTRLVGAGWDSKTIDFAINNCLGVKASRKKILLGVFVILFVLIGVGGVYGYFFYTKSPKVIVLKAIQNMQETQSFNHTGGFLIDFKAESDFLGSIDENLLINFDGSIDKVNNSNEVSFTISGNPAIEGIGITIKAIDNFVYARINNAPDIVLTEAPFLIDQWLGIDISEAMSMAEIDWPEISEAELINLFLEHQDKFLIIAESPLTNSDLYVYNISIDRVAFMDFIKEAESLLGEDFDYYEFENLLKSIEDISFDVWINKDSLMFSKIEFSNEFKDDIGKLKLFLSINFDKYNSIDSITIPQNFKTVEDIMMDSFLYEQDTFEILKET